MEEKTFYEHLDELKKRIIKSLIAILLGSILAYLLKNQLFDLLIKPYGKDLVFLSVTEAFANIIKLSFIAGIILSFPYIIYQLWEFIASLFEKQKRKIILTYMIVSLLLFYGAIIFCYFVILPTAINFLVNFGGLPLVPAITFNNYLNFSLLMLLSFGVIFQFPLILAALIKLKLVSIKTLSKKIPYVIVLIFVIASIVTPTPDAFTMILLALPMILLFEITLLIARLTRTVDEHFKSF